MRRFLLPALTFVFTGCSSTINTLPPVGGSVTPIQEVLLDIPAGLEIRSIDYSATMYPDVSGTGSGPMSTTAGGRAFVQVVAMDRVSGEQVLLLYENIMERRQPIQIIRFRAGAGGASPSR